MKPDGRRDPRSDARLDRIERAHLRDPGDVSHTIHRYEPPADLAPLVQRFWVPVWSVPPGSEAPQSVLQYPVALIVITADYSRFSGVISGLSTTILAGEGWAVGVLFAPAAGSILTGGSMAEWTDRVADLDEVLSSGTSTLVDEVRRAMERGPSLESSHELAIDAFTPLLRPLLPVDPEGTLVNALVAFVEGRADVTRVAQLCEEFDLSERSLQRLVRRRLGLTPKWLIQRRRLQEAAGRLRDGGGNLAEVAANLGYADQPHFTHDFHTITGMTPGEFAAKFA